ncbi:efflux transporter outer membrane subunit [Crenobacter sp. SG2303]|uniref:Efflux transporter outer membrane subunit n=1 Tax=Crenobacter oryzisoli TaxID=3056844 RepID=A0ABT7XV17_9NEIS|nr:efflux transporter outer membrane subunit [Crenobacter sp. SG2303]MDN0077575.1 efflux transporter outer membrane subunit [Crenobacter sp. SG2303]
MTVLRCSLLLAMGGALAGCASVPDLGPRAQIHTSTQLQSTQSLAGTNSAWVEQQWWKRYGDTQLDALMDEALANSPDLTAAEARILKAEGYAQQTGASRLPSVDLDASVTRMKQSYNNGVPKPLVPQGFNNASRVALDFSYELDFWGKNRAAVAAATSELDAARAEAAQSRLLLTSAIASAYAELARLYAEHDAAVQAVDARRGSEMLMSERQQQGLETMASVRQAESRRAAAEADLTAADQAIALQHNALAALVGAGPDRGLSISRPTVDLSQPQGLPSTLRAELLARRPDLTAARLRAEAAAKRIDVAHAGFYPNVNLTAYVGAQSLGGLGLLTKAGSGIAGIGPAIDLPIFHGGQLEGNYRVARGEYDNAVASYNQTLIQALREVADAVTAQRMLAPQLQQREEALKAAEQAYRVAQERYQGGLTNYLTVLNAEDSVIDARRVLANLQSQQFSQDVALIKALGGGYRDKQA